MQDCIDCTCCGRCCGGSRLFNCMVAVQLADYCTSCLDMMLTPFLPPDPPLCRCVDGNELVVPPGLDVPVLAAGTVLAVFRDFIASTVVVLHTEMTDERGRLLCSAYGHVVPGGAVAPGAMMASGSAVGHVAPNDRTAVPHHVHLSLGWWTPTDDTQRDDVDARSPIEPTALVPKAINSWPELTARLELFFPGLRTPWIPHQTSVSDTPLLLPDVPLVTVAALLEGRDARAARLVCRQWQWAVDASRTKLVFRRGTRLCNMISLLSRCKSAVKSVSVSRNPDAAALVVWLINSRISRQVRKHSTQTNFLCDARMRYIR